MDFEEAEINGVYLIKHDIFTDSRGSFIKPYHHDKFSEFGLESNFKEAYYTLSKKDVIRGMHFQTSPFGHAKLITVIEGRITDIVLDIRRSSISVGEHIAVELSRDNNRSLFVPAGCAHGFKVMSEYAIVNYLVTSVHAPANDKGIRYDSFGYDWQVSCPIVSDRDLMLPAMEEFEDYFP